MKNLYDILGVDPDADASAVKAAYKARSRATHPDKEGGIEEEFKAVSAAWECLSDPDARRRYDETGEMPQSVPRDLAEATFMQVLDGQIRAGKLTSTKSILKAVREKLEAAQEKVEDQLNELKAHIGTLEKQLGRYQVEINPVDLKPYEEVNLIESCLASAINNYRGVIAVGEIELRNIKGALEHCARYRDPREAEDDLSAFNMNFIYASSAGRSGKMDERTKRMMRDLGL